MLCSACSADILTSFLRSFSIHPTNALKTYAAQTPLRRSIHTGPLSYRDRGSSTSLEHGATTPPLSYSLDKTSPLFESPKSSLRARKPRAPVFSSALNLTSAVQSSTESGNLDAQHLHKPTQQDVSSINPTAQTRNAFKKGVSFTPNADNAGLSHADLNAASHDRTMKKSLIKIRQIPSQGLSYDSPEAKRQRRTFREAAQRSTLPDGFTRKEREPWQIQKKALKEKFGEEGWLPRKRLSPDALDGIRALHAQYPEQYTTEALADQFKVSPEAIRRILKSKWRPNDEEDVERRQRWLKRGENIWTQMVELGVKPPKKWREMGVGKPPELRTEQQKARYRESLTDDGESISVYDELMEAHREDAPSVGRHPGRALSDIIL